MKKLALWAVLAVIVASVGVYGASWTETDGTYLRPFQTLRFWCNAIIATNASQTNASMNIVTPFTDPLDAFNACVQFNSRGKYAVRVRLDDASSGTLVTDLFSRIAASPTLLAVLTPHLTGVQYITFLTMQENFSNDFNRLALILTNEHNRLGLSWSNGYNNISIAYTGMVQAGDLISSNRLNELGVALTAMVQAVGLILSNEHNRLGLALTNTDNQIYVLLSNKYNQAMLELSNKYNQAVLDLTNKYNLTMTVASNALNGAGGGTATYVTAASVGHLATKTNTTLWGDISIKENSSTMSLILEADDSTAYPFGIWHYDNQNFITTKVDVTSYLSSGMSFGHIRLKNDTIANGNRFIGHKQNDPFTWGFWNTAGTTPMRVDVGDATGPSNAVNLSYAQAMILSVSNWASTVGSGIQASNVTQHAMLTHLSNMVVNTSNAIVSASGAATYSSVRSLLGNLDKLSTTGECNVVVSKTLQGAFTFTLTDTVYFISSFSNVDAYVYLATNTYLIYPTTAGTVGLRINNIWGAPSNGKALDYWIGTSVNSYHGSIAVGTAY